MKTAGSVGDRPERLFSSQKLRLLARPVQQQAELVQHISPDEDLICNVVAYDLDAGQGQATNFDINQVRAYAAPTSNVASHCFEGNNARFQLPDDPNWYDGCISSGVQEGVDRAEN
ncbi:MAG TPA: hypothetical protein PK170_08680, partial [Anaerolineae bacterium]|nr:hypothetical protein [Anaerolineae bacterium]